MSDSVRVEVECTVGDSTVTYTAEASSRREAIDTIVELMAADEADSADSTKEGLRKALASYGIPE